MKKDSINFWRHLVFGGLVAGAILATEVGMIHNRLKKGENLLEQYSHQEFASERAYEGRTYWQCAAEDVKEHPELREAINKRLIDMHDITGVYAKINNGYPVSGKSFNRPKWKFE